MPQISWFDWVFNRFGFLHIQWRSFISGITMKEVCRANNLFPPTLLPSSHLFLAVSYFRFRSNQLDLFILLLQYTYFSLAISAYLIAHHTPATSAASASTHTTPHNTLALPFVRYVKNAPYLILHGSTDLLLIATIISYVRLLAVFSINKTLVCTPPTPPNSDPPCE